MPSIDRSTIEALRRGEERAYAAVIQELDVPVYRFLLRLSGDSGAAEDLTQETFLAVWQGIDRFMERSKFATWVFGIAYRQFLRHRDKRMPETTNQEWEPCDVSDMSDPSDTAVRADEREQIRQAVYSLPHPYREVVILVHLDGLSYGETAEVLEIPVGTVKSRMNGAFRLLREKLRGIEVQGDEMRQSEGLPGQRIDVL